METEARLAKNARIEAAVARFASSKPYWVEAGNTSAKKEDDGVRSGYTAQETRSSLVGA